VLDLERVRQAVQPVVDDQPVLGVFAADLLVDFGRRRRRPRPELDQERVGLRVIQCGLAQSWLEPPVQEGIVHRAAVWRVTTRNHRRSRGTHPSIARARPLAARFGIGPSVPPQRHRNLSLPAWH
jgi:hypothetical protein